MTSCTGSKVKTYEFDQHYAERSEAILAKLTLKNIDETAAIFLKLLDLNHGGTATSAINYRANKSPEKVILLLKLIIRILELERERYPDVESEFRKCLKDLVASVPYLTHLSYKESASSQQVHKQLFTGQVTLVGHLTNGGILEVELTNQMLESFFKERVPHSFDSMILLLSVCGNALGATRRDEWIEKLKGEKMPKKLRFERCNGEFPNDFVVESDDINELFRAAMMNISSNSSFYDSDDSSEQLVEPPRLNVAVEAKKILNKLTARSLDAAIDEFVKFSSQHEGISALGQMAKHAGLHPEKANLFTKICKGVIARELEAHSGFQSEFQQNLNSVAASVSDYLGFSKAELNSNSQLQNHLFNGCIIMIGHLYAEHLLESKVVDDTFDILYGEHDEPSYKNMISLLELAGNEIECKKRDDWINKLHHEKLEKRTRRRLASVSKKLKKECQVKN